MAGPEGIRRSPLARMRRWGAWQTEALLRTGQVCEVPNAGEYEDFLAALDADPDNAASLAELRLRGGRDD